MVFISKEKLHVSAYKIHIHIHTELPNNPLTSHQFSLTIAHRMIMRSQHHHAVKQMAAIGRNM